MQSRGISLGKIGASSFIVFILLAALPFALAKGNDFTSNEAAVEKEPISITPVSGGGGVYELKENIEKHIRREEKNKFDFTGIVEHYVNGELQSAETYLRGKNLELVDKVNDKNLEDIDFFDITEDTFVFELELKRPVGEELFIGNPATVPVEFELTEEYKVWFEERGFDVYMESCDLIVNPFATSVKDISIINLFRNGFESVHSLSFYPEATYEVRVVCEHEVGYGVSNTVKFRVTSGPTNPGEDNFPTGSGDACETPWDCTDWSPCVNGERVRNCEKLDGNRFCYADLTTMPAEVESCTPQFNTLSQNIEGEVSQGFVSRITGAVVGAANKVGYLGASLFIVLLIVASALVRVIKKR